MTRFCCLSLVVALASDLSVNSQSKDPPKKPAFTNSLGMEFALIPKGKSWLGGSNGKEGTKEVNLAQDFYMGVYEVTQEEWEKVMGKNPSWMSRTGVAKNKVKDIPDADLKRFPVEGVTRSAAEEFIKMVNEKVKKDAKEGGWEYRLPTSAEWEYACRGGPMTDKAESAFDFYFEKPSMTMSKEQANFRDSGLERPCKVGSYPPNKLGLYDMHGNVNEMCENPPGGKGFRRNRGGSYSDSADLQKNQGQVFAQSCQAAFEYGGGPGFTGSVLGLRLARVPSGGDKKDAKKDDEDKLQGEWVIVSAETSDKSFAGLKDKKVLVKGSEWTEPLAKNGPMVKFLFKIDPTKNPKQLDLMATLGGSKEQVKEQTWRGIYKIDGITLTFCRGFPDGERPTEFKAGPKALRMVFQRAGN